MEEMPMVQDSGTRDLNQSRHHPNAGLGAQLPSSATTAVTEGPITGRLDEIAKGISSLVGSVLWEAIGPRYNEAIQLAEARGQRAADATTTRCECENDNSPVTMGGLRTALNKHAEQGKKSWAKVAAAALPTRTHAANTPKAIIPARRSREVMIKTAQQDEALAGRTPTQIIQAINTALMLPPGAVGAVAARTLFSGDIIVTFKDDAGQYMQKGDWVTKAFGETATVKGREIAVHVSGLPARPLRGISDDDLTKQLSQHNGDIMRAKKQIPKHPEARFATAVLHLSSAEAAMALCSNGVIWEAQIFDCSPYNADLKITQCFRCYAFGHIQTYCARAARCGGCGSAAHGDGGKQGEEQCPQKQGDGTFKEMTCCNCGGKHTAWDRRCKAAKAEQARIKEAYATRPKQFEIGTAAAPPRRSPAERAETSHQWQQILQQPNPNRIPIGIGRGRRGSNRGSSRASRGRSRIRQMAAARAQLPSRANDDTQADGVHTEMTEAPTEPIDPWE